MADMTDGPKGIASFPKTSRGLGVQVRAIAQAQRVGDQKGIGKTVSAMARARKKNK